MIWTKRLTASLCLACMFALSGCAFNLISIQQRPAEFQKATDSGHAFSLISEVKPRLNEGKATRLKAGTNWTQIGAVAEGAVYHTKDQAVTVEASNQFEADIVVKGTDLVGFYLPVQNSFVAVATPIALPFK